MEMKDKTIWFNSDSWHYHVAKTYGCLRYDGTDIVSYSFHVFYGGFICVLLTLVTAAIIYPWLDLLLATSAGSTAELWPLLVIEAIVGVFFFSTIGRDWAPTKFIINKVAKFIDKFRIPVQIIDKDQVWQKLQQKNYSDD